MGLLLIGKLPPKECVIYIVAQLIGSVVAMFVAWCIEKPGATLALTDTFPGATNGTAVADGYLGPIVGGEIFYTFLLVFVVLNVAVADAKNQYYGLAIAFVIVAGAVAEGGFSGGCFNPAVSFGLDIGSLWMGKGNSKFGYGFLYMGVQFVAAGLAAAVFKIVRQTEYADEEE